MPAGAGLAAVVLITFAAPAASVQALTLAETSGPSVFGVVMVLLLISVPLLTRLAGQR